MHRPVPLAADRPVVTDEETFRAFYERTARQLWGLLYRATRNASLADDLLQEAYYRLLRAPGPFESETHRVHYLFRIALNLAADARRRRGPETMALDDERGGILAVGAEEAAGIEQRTDLHRALATLAPRDRDLLWLAYAHGESHEEIASRLGLQRLSIKVLLSRARRRLAARLRGVVESLPGRSGAR